MTNTTRSSLPIPIAIIVRIMSIVVLPLEVKAHHRRRPNAARDERNPEEEAAGMDGDPRRVDARATNAPSPPNEPVRAPSPMLPPGET
eukprot:CAMPEP_0196148386 /NCGR_PEP_ID=MMETSP0910-20130528/27612_1 /TAXON_ID=49265 /ORGANISM="Thalassiosira rotula, Strain GSO102" /LENGTH=87 /DNA_ID=CAMNT_0041411075 /DNA_START=28 /DNA_END=287 /DNA_ORIENTATION=-